MKGMESGIFVGVVVVAVMLCLGLITSRATKRKETSFPIEIPASFQISPWILNFYRLVLVISLLGGLSISLFMDQVGNHYLFYFLPVLFGFLSFLGLLLDSKKRVLITETEIEYSAMIGSFRVPLNKIRSVYGSNGFIVIDYGEKTRKVIPIMFKGSSVILRYLQEISIAQPAAGGDATR